MNSKHFRSEEMTTEEKLEFRQQEREKLELYFANKERIDAYYAYMRDLLQVQVENQILNQMQSIDIDSLSLEELQNILIQVQSFQTAEEAKSPKTKF